ncbi:MAG: hydroxymethylglutaryl-CoA lyase [Thermincola sp.]|nr:hydroxymethylglutaryl-CoA lyase [Thermincola sp.]MDT3702031.1 hydroxymethylglutaryl-CoA lyase [Thermincola sp.]
MFNKLPEKVRVVEVGMRDGLQNEKVFVPTEEKINLINKLSETGLCQIEITSFVSPRVMPQLADNMEVALNIARKDGINYTALVPNKRGLESAKAAGIKEVVFFLSASEGHSMKNINKSVKEALRVGEEVVQEASAAGIKVRVNLSTVFGCPFDGPINPQKVLQICRELLAMGVYEVALSDTIGVANPRQVAEVINLLAGEIDLGKIAVHFHDTRGSGLANVLASLQCGITTIDSSFGGLGTCPYTSGASGNIATEDLVYMLHGMGIETGINLDQLVKCSQMAQKLLSRTLPSKYLQTRTD